jgi:RNA polymerase sigma factor (sigma-70 family)
MLNESWHIIRLFSFSGHSAFRFHLAPSAKREELRKMKIEYTYRFNNETITIEVTEGDYDILIELDRIERNVNQKETRRHASLDAFNLDGNLFPSEEDVEAECIQNEEYIALHKAINQLLPQQRELIKKVFFENRTIVSIAREEGVGESAIRDRLSRIYKKLKKFSK